MIPCTEHTYHTTVNKQTHCNDVIMDTMASKIISLAIVYSTDYSGIDQRKHQSSASLALVRGIHRRPVNSPHKWPVTRKMFDDVIMYIYGNSAGGREPVCCSGVYTQTRYQLKFHRVGLGTWCKPRYWWTIIELIGFRMCHRWTQIIWICTHV